MSTGSDDAGCVWGLFWKVNNALTLKAGVISLFDESYGTQREIFRGVCRSACVAVNVSF